MNPAKSAVQPRRGAVPLIDCHELAQFKTDSPEAVQEGFKNASTPCPLQQTWLEREEADFAPANIRTGWRDSNLLIFAELTDRDIFNRATKLNQRTWELGDVLEIFLRPVDQLAYVEFQVTPENQRLQLRYANAAAVASARSTGSIEDALIHGDAFRSMTWVRPGTNNGSCMPKYRLSPFAMHPGP